MRDAPAIAMKHGELSLIVSNLRMDKKFLGSKDFAKIAETVFSGICG